MRIALRHMGKRHWFREKPEMYSVCHTFKPTRYEHDCSCTGSGPKRQKIHVATIPFGKRYFDCDPCKNYHVCDPLIAERAEPERLRNMWRTQCCPECK